MKKILLLSILTMLVLTGCSNQNDKSISTDTDSTSTDKVATNNNFDNSIKCNQIGSTFFDKMKGEEDIKDKSIGKRYWEQPEYHYNNKLNSCLILIKYTLLRTSSPTYVSIIKDVLSNKILATSSYSEDGKFSVNLSADEFDRQANDLMNN